MATWPTVTDDDGTGTTGTILDNALFTSIQTYIGGAWTAVSHSAGNFTASGAMTWTVASGDQATFSYVEVGKTMHISLNVITASVGGTPNGELRFAVPNSRTIGARPTQGSFHYLDNGTAGTGLWSASAGLTYIKLHKDANAVAWTASTNMNYIYAAFTIEIV